VPPIPIEYTQCHSANSFVDGLSIIDFLFNCGFEYVSEKLQQDIHQYKFNKKDR